MLEVTTRSGTNGFASRLVGETRAEVWGEFAGNCVGKIHEMKENTFQVTALQLIVRHGSHVLKRQRQRMKQDRAKGQIIFSSSEFFVKTWLVPNRRFKL